VLETCVRYLASFLECVGEEGGAEGTARLLSKTGAVLLSIIEEGAIVLYKINFLLQSMPGVIALRGRSISQLGLPRLL